jgi:diketogulonate reductase-like aldo/keto reductase
MTIFGHMNYHVKGFSMNAPTEYLGLVGIAEAFLYIFRLHEVIQNKLGTREEDKEKIRGYIDQIQRTFEETGFDSDLLGREIPFWVQFLHESTMVMHEFILDPNPSVLLPPIEIAKYFTGYTPQTSSDSNSKSATKSSTKKEFTDIPESPTHIMLADGGEMPLLGLGTWQLDGQECYDSVYTALKLGYRLIDTAQAYRNEHEVGRAIEMAMKEGIITREEIWIATKISDPEDFTAVKVKALVNKQLQDLHTTYIDLYMLHSPPGSPEAEKETWLALEELHAQGIIKHLGVSNYEPKELDRLFSIVQKVKPQVVQNKVDVYHVGKQLDTQGDEIVAYCKQHQLLLLGYSPFSAYPFVMEATHDPLIELLADSRKMKNGRKVTPAQMILRWMFDRNIAAIPRSSNKDRLMENLQAIYMEPLSDDELAIMDSLQLLISSPVSIPISLV